MILYSSMVLLGGVARSSSGGHESLPGRRTIGAAFLALFAIIAHARRRAAKQLVNLGACECETWQRAMILASLCDRDSEWTDPSLVSLWAELLANSSDAPTHRGGSAATATRDLR
jgi:hypothetical protein